MRTPLAAAFLALASLAAGQDFYETQLRAGEAALSGGRAAEAADDLRIAAFGFLGRPAMLCEALANLALAEQAAGRAAQADAVLGRFAEVERGFPACREARLDPERRAEFEALVRRKLPAPAAEGILAPPKRPTAAAPMATPTRAAPAPSPSAAEPAPARAPAPMAVVAPASPPGAARPDSVPVFSPDDLDRQPQLKVTTRPVYPAGAERSEGGAIVLLSVLVSEKGEPLRVEVARGVRPDLDQAAVTAVRQWLFDPGRKGGTPVAAWMTVAVPFEAPRR
jgi:TonB family protein